MPVPAGEERGTPPWMWPPELQVIAARYLLAVIEFAGTVPAAKNNNRWAAFIKAAHLRMDLVLVRNSVVLRSTDPGCFSQPKG